VVFGCGVLRAGGLFAESIFGAAALWDLTSAARELDNLTLTPPEVPTWTFAGTACSGSPAWSLLPRYEYPSDGIVGISSAYGEQSPYGVSANLGPLDPSHQPSGPDYHNTSSAELIGNLLAPVFGCLPAFTGHGVGIELNDPRVINDVISAATSVLAGSTSRSPDVAGVSRDRGHASEAKSAAKKPARLVLNLQTGAIRSLRPGSKLVAGAGSALVSAYAFTVSCDGHPVPALPGIGGRVFGFPTGMLSCRQARLAGHRTVAVGMLSDPDRVKATITRIRNRLVITITASRPITQLMLTRGKKILRLRQRRQGRRTVQIALTTAQASNLTMTAKVNRRTYTATIPAID
jgi:hypothetical protein